jgi:hypothetical protein
LLSGITLFLLRLWLVRLLCVYVLSKCSVLREVDLPLTTQNIADLHYKKLYTPVYRSAHEFYPITSEIYAVVLWFVCET